MTDLPPHFSETTYPELTKDQREMANVLMDVTAPDPIEDPDGYLKHHASALEGVRNLTPLQIEKLLAAATIHALAEGDPPEKDAPQRQRRARMCGRGQLDTACRESEQRQSM